MSNLKQLLDDGVDLSTAIGLLPQLRKCRKGKFDIFWESTEKVINEDDLAVADERRQSETSWISPKCSSLRNLYKMCQKKMTECFPESDATQIPSYEYFRLQFAPRNSHALTSRRYYSRFNIKFGLQTRTLRKQHVDQHYACKQWKIVKEFSCLYRENTIMIFWDDKAQIPIGYNAAPASVVPRQRPVLMVGLDQRGLNSVDHDNIPQHLTPSVIIKLTPPDNVSGDWYVGKPSVALKDSIFEYSTAFRHVTEFRKGLSEEDAEKPIMCFGSDGGRDHNVTGNNFISLLILIVSLIIP